MKDKKKIKIKDLTDEQKMAIHKKYQKNDCEGCPLNYADAYCIQDLDFNKEIEVENGKELEDDKPNQCDCRPSDVSWEEHQKTLLENAELKDIIVELNKEINAMKKGYTK